MPALPSVQVIRNGAVVTIKVTNNSPPELRFWTRVRKTETCWLWTGALESNGYGVIMLSGRRTMAQEFSWRLNTGGVCADDQRVSQSCENRLCVNPEHLFMELREPFRGDDRNSAEYVAWKNMRRRCQRNSVDRKNYYDRGISVCDRWNSYSRFLEDMGRKPGSDMTIERRDNNKGYSPENCEWATRTEQSRNRRFNRVVEFRGEAHCLSEWAEILGVKATTIKRRADRGQPLDVSMRGRK